ncbi:UNVERIFIED_CONTAM: hypothetical protein Sradi_7150100 [Sesamum radiatum]|uniref:Reverse transcriptase zinc-binding domain-containing protein n=1 Tax=Sesamum radiatum TaxID=300843 RepID=A0AAW2IVM4_SESRA
MTVIQHGNWNWPSEIDFHIQEIISGLPNISLNQSDTILWRTNGGKFTTAAAFSVLQPPSVHVLWSFIGRKFKIPRHDFILWLGILEHLSTMDRPWVVQQDTGCVLCEGAHAESHEHLFFKCLYSTYCITVLKLDTQFQCSGLGWRRDVIWASKRWRGKHLLNVTARTLLASLTCNIWMQHNRRRFTSTEALADTVARKAIEDVRLRIISEDVSPSLQRSVLYRIWKIPWDRN